MKHLPGFRFDGKAGRAAFEVIVPGPVKASSGKRSSRRRRATVEAATMAEALEKWKAFREEVLSESREPPPPPLTFARYVAEHDLAVLLPSKLSQRSERESLRNHLLPFFGADELERLSIARVRDFVGAKRTEGYAATSINRALATLRKYLLDAVDRGVLARYPLTRRLPRLKEERIERELTELELRRFLHAFEDERAFRVLMAKRGDVARGERIERRQQEGRAIVSLHGAGRRSDGAAMRYHFERFRSSKPFFVVAVETGLATCDLFGLRWAHVDLKEGLIRVPRKKTGVEALIPISPACREALEAVSPVGPAGAEPVEPEPTELVFNGGDDVPASETMLRRYFRIARELAGLDPKARLYDVARHTFASRLASKNVSLQVIAKMLGHASIQMSQRYARPDEESLRRAIAAVGLSTSSPRSSRARLKTTPDDSGRVGTGRK